MSHPSPELTDALVGREGALASLRDAWRDAGAIVTVLGPPGIGKTTLASAFLEDFAPTTTIVVSLVSAQSARDVCARVAAAAGVTIPGQFDETEALSYVNQLLRERGYERVLFDNADPIVTVLGQVLKTWVQDASSLRVLVTSRERLGIPRERVVEIGPLSADAGARLFRLRAARWQDESREDAWAEESLSALVKSLDGVPLAIELAAARASMLGTDEMRARLGSRFDWLKVPQSAGETRHAGLWNAIEWSWNFLDDEERVALATLSLLATSFTADIACELLGRSEEEGFAQLEALRNKSLVSASRLSRRTHFSLLESIREFSRVKLAEMPERDIIHARFVTVLASRCERVLEAYDRRGFVAMASLLGGERENLRFALSLTTPSTREWFLLTRALASALQVEGLQPELEAFVETTLESHAARLPAPERAILHRLHGFALFARGRNALALAAGERAIACHGQAPSALAEAHVLMAVCHRQAGDLVAAEAECRRGIEVLDGRQCRALGLASANLGLILAYGGAREEARVANEQALRSFEDCGDPWGQGLALGNLGELAQEDGDLVDARRFVESAIRSFKEARDPRYEAVYTSILATIEHEAGRPDVALAYYRSSTDALQRLRGPYPEALARGAHAALLASAGRVPEAEVEIERAESILSAGGHPFIREALRLHRMHLAPVAERRAALASAGDLSHGVRFARRLLARSLPSEDIRTLTVARDARHFSVEGSRVDLTRRGSLRRILAALVEAKQQSPDPQAPRALNARELIRVGWPGEVVREDAASNRLRVAITTLRKLGLADVLVTRDDGYVLHATIIVS